jgi:superfamily II DNA/RNA helicase
LSYALPIICHCVRTLLCEATHTRHSNHSTRVHGLILVPTRELAIQVSKEVHLVAKVAKKYLSKCAPVDADTSMRVESIPVYGGVDIESQVSSLLGTDESISLSLVVVATPGRLLDILESDSNRKSAASAFGNLQAIVFDEADRIAMNADMAGQVDDIVSVLRSVRVNSSSVSNGGDVLSCLVSATLPEKAKEMCEKWVPRSRIVVKVDSVMMGNEPSANHPCETNDGEDDEESANASPSKRNISQNIDLSSIPSNIVQTLHVCSNHKKPKKLILTLQRIYNKKDEGKGRFSVNNRLTIVFFGQIKTVKYVSKLLVKEGLRCVELYGSLHQTEREKRLLEFKSGGVVCCYRCYYQTM